MSHRSHEGESPFAPFRPLDQRPRLPDFPALVLPSWLREMVAALADEAQVPLGLTATTGLGVLAAACQGAAVVEIKPGWAEPLNGYYVTALPSGSNKSGVFKRLLAPVAGYQAQLVEETADARIKDAAGRAAAEAERRAAIRKLGRRLTGDERQEVLNVVENAERVLSKPARLPPRFLVADLTPESMGIELAAQDGRLVWASPEGNEIFDLITGRYDSNGGAKLEVFLKAWSGESIDVRRVGREPVIVDSACVTIIAACQPVVCSGLRARPGQLEARGVLGRLLLSTPTSMVGRRVLHRGSVGQDVEEAYTTQVQRLLRAPRDRQRKLALPFDAFNEFFARYEGELGPGGSLSHMESWGSKARSHGARVAGLLHLASGQQTDIVSEDVLTEAVAITDYFAAHAAALWSTSGGDEAGRRALLLWGYVLKELDSSGNAAVSRTALHRRAIARFPKVGDLTDPLARLIERGYLRALPTSPVGPAGGRPRSPVYEVNEAARAYGRAA